MSNPSLLPPSSSELERRLALSCSGISDLDVPLRDLWSPWQCPLEFLPYLAWARSVDRWDETWPENVKRRVVADAFFIHQRKGTRGALRRVVETFGFLVHVIEWWKTGDVPGSFRLDIGVEEQGITEENYQELERLIADAKPCSRHLLGLTLSLQTSGGFDVAAGGYIGDTLTVYPWLPEMITVGGESYMGGATHLIDTMEITRG